MKKVYSNLTELKNDFPRKSVSNDRNLAIQENEQDLNSALNFMSMFSINRYIALDNGIAHYFEFEDFLTGIIGGIEEAPFQYNYLEIECFESIKETILKYYGYDSDYSLFACILTEKIFNEDVMLKPLSDFSSHISDELKAYYIECEIWDVSITDIFTSFVVNRIGMNLGDAPYVSNAIQLYYSVLIKELAIINDFELANGNTEIFDLSILK